VLEKHDVGDRFEKIVWIFHKINDVK
jgi:hypothetical protein